MLIPCTITALRTRRCVSTLYHHHTAHRLDFEPMDGGGRPSFQSPKVSDLPAHVFHFSAAAYTRRRVRSLPSKINAGHTDTESSWCSPLQKSALFASARSIAVFQ